LEKPPLEIFTSEGLFPWSFLYLAGLQGLYGNPDAFYLAGFQHHANALQVGSKRTLGVFYQAGADPSTFFTLTFSGDASALMRSLPGYYTNF
jgi:hypothetical protein